MVHGIGYDASGVTLHMTGSSGPHVLGTHTGTWHDEHRSCLTAMLAIAEVLVRHRTQQDAVCAEFATRWQTLLTALTHDRGGPPPYSAQALASAATNRIVTDAMMAATDALYYAIKALAPVFIDSAEPQPRAINADALDDIVYGSAAPPLSSPQPLPTTSPTTGTVATLQRLLRRGGTALLVGPTGVGKTYAVKQAVLAEGARLVIVKGRPGLDDRHLYGGIDPTADHYQWVDGPLAKAWRTAHAGEHVVLVIDKLARLDPYHLAALIGALDPSAARNLCTWVLRDDSDADHHYYVLAAWYFNAATLRITATLRQFGDRVTLTFGDVLAFAGTLLQSTATQLIALGLAVAACGSRMQPLIERQTLINLRVVPWLLLVVLAGFPSAGVAYLTVEGIRRDLADTT
jgi:hypothetical protein